MQSLNSFVSAIIGDPEVSATIGILLIFTFADVVLGIVAALKTHTFEWVKVANFVGDDLGKVVVAMVFGLGTSNPYVSAVFYAVSSAVLATVVAKINSNFKTVFGTEPHIMPPPLPPMAGRKNAQPPDK